MSSIPLVSFELQRLQYYQCHVVRLGSCFSKLGNRRINALDQFVSTPLRMTEHHRNRYQFALGMTNRWYTARKPTKKETKNKQTKSATGKKVAADEEGD